MISGRGVRSNTDSAGLDASQEFEDVGHSTDAITKRDELLVGEFDVCYLEMNLAI